MSRFNAVALGLTDAQLVQALGMRESELQEHVLAYAKLRGWMRVHITPAWVHDRNRPRMVTPYQGDKGLPDNIFARDQRVFLAELKREDGKVSDTQQLWLNASGAYLWRPSDWLSGRIQLILD